MSDWAKDYVEVPERIRQFYERYPEGSLQCWIPPYIEEKAGKPFVVYAAAAYRTPDDPRPGIGWAWEPVPGPTPYTKDSELMNAETSAWGRAIAALGFATKNIASAEEVRNRRGDSSNASPQNGQDGPGNTSASAPASDGVLLSEKQLGMIRRLGREIKAVEPEFEITMDALVQEYGVPVFEQLSKGQASDLITRLMAKKAGAAA